MFTVIYIIIILISMPFFIKNEDWSWFTCFLYFGLCLLLTPVLAIPFWVWWRSRWWASCPLQYCCLFYFWYKLFFQLTHWKLGITSLHLGESPCIIQDKCLYLQHKNKEKGSHYAYTLHHCYTNLHVLRHQGGRLVMANLFYLFGSLCCFYPSYRYFSI